MAYIITYRKNNETHTLEWIVPTGWSTAAIQESFEQQFPGAAVITIAACREGCLVG
jgi:hypothetical protein